jgi:hypothetical protein
MAKDIAALKAVSQNLMDANLSITDGVYGILSDKDVKGRIASLSEGGAVVARSEYERLAALLKEFLVLVEERRC